MLRASLLYTSLLHSSQSPAASFILASTTAFPPSHSRSTCSRQPGTCVHTMTHGKEGSDTLLHMLRIHCIGRG